MPARIKALLHVDDPAAVKPEHLHAVASGLFDNDKNHRTSMKGWTAAFLNEASDPDLQSAGITEWEFGVVNDTLIGPCLERLQATRDLRFGRQRCEVAASGLAEFTEWYDVADSAGPNDTWAFDLLTPTTFRSGAIAQPAPFPGTMFGHLRSRWNAFAPADLDIEVELSACGLAITYLAGTTASVTARSTVFPGFVGTVIVRAYERDHSIRTRLDALTRLARYCGIGSNTTMGMGVCQVAALSTETQGSPQ